MTDFNYAIVGAGSAGAPLAARLTEDPAIRVLLVEAGPDYPAPGALPPDLLDARRNAGTQHDWPYVAEPVPGATMPYRRGRLVGGTSAINAAIAVRATAADFDEWVALGNPAWAWEAVSPYFRRIEDDRDYRDDWHGVGGPLPIVRWRPDEWTPRQRAFYHACRAVGLADLPDYNYPAGSGVGSLPMNRIGTTRISTARAYLDPARGRPNLIVRPHSLVNRIAFRGTRAIGVELVGDAGIEMVQADRVVLTAGAIGSPAILLRSGIGPAADLAALDIAPRVDLPGVGAHLSDHPTIPLWLVPPPGTLDLEAPVFQVLARYTASGSSDVDDMMLVLQSYADTSARTTPAISAAVAAPLAPVIRAALMRPRAAGRVTLTSSDLGAQPHIALNYVGDPEDLRRLMDGVRRAWRVAQTPEMRGEHVRIAGVDEALLDADGPLAEYVRVTVGTFCHALGTARMGPDGDPGAVVDERCRVRGVENLWVADASVMPAVPHVMPNLTTIMIGERVADWLRQGDDVRVG